MSNEQYEDGNSTESADLSSTESADLSSTKSADLSSTKSADLSSTKSADLSSTESADLNNTESANRNSSYSPSHKTIHSTRHSRRKYHHHHHHHHSGHHYDGPRSHQAEDLPEEYQLRLTDDVPEQKPEEEIVNFVIDDDFSERPEFTQKAVSRDSGSHRSGKKRRHRRKKLDSWGRRNRTASILIRVLLGIVGLLLVLIAAFFILRFRGEKNLEKTVVETPVEVELPEEAEKEDETNLVVYNGERYWYNEDVITVLCIGVDREEFVSADDMVIGGNGQADADVLMVIDKKSGKISLLNISRECNVDVDRYNADGQFIDTKKEQLCLSYAFGDGGKTSCENTALSVSRLLYGMPINAYVAIDFESVGILNDAVGGVTVPITEEVAEKFPGAAVGSNVDLVGSEAVTYIRTRDTKVLDSNNARMSRQKQYLLAFIKKAIAQLKKDPGKAVSLYKAISDNMVTSVKLSEVTYFGTLFAKLGFKDQNLYSLKGEVVEAEDGYALFMPDEKALYETVLDLFYIKE